MSHDSQGSLRPFEPTNFGRFTLLAPLASGGMGQIYLARTHFQGGLEKLCVIKKVLPQLADDPDFVSRFLDEARTLVELQHGSIAQVYDTGIEDGEYWIALEFVDGKDLRRLIQRLRARGEKLPLPLSLYVAIKILEALAHAHRKRDASGRQLNLVHRDVSPQNVLLSYEGEVKVIDFGLAHSKLTGSTDGSVVMGKFHYMAPEQARGAEVDRRADLYALGVILYEMLSGWNPFEDAPQGEILEWAAFPRIPPIERVSPGLPAAVAIAVGQALSVRPAERFQTAEEMRRALSDCLSELGPAPGPDELGQLLLSEFQAEYERERSWIASFAKRENKPSRAAEEETQIVAAPQLSTNTLRFEGEGEELPWHRGHSGGHAALRSAAAAARSEPGNLPWYDQPAPTTDTARRDRGPNVAPAAFPPPPGPATPIPPPPGPGGLETDAARIPRPEASPGPRGHVTDSARIPRPEASPGPRGHVTDSARIPRPEASPGPGGHVTGSARIPRPEASPGPGGHVTGSARIPRPEASPSTGGSSPSAGAARWRQLALVASVSAAAAAGVLWLGGPSQPASGADTPMGADQGSTALPVPSSAVQGTAAGGRDAEVPSGASGGPSPITDSTSGAIPAENALEATAADRTGGEADAAVAAGSDRAGGDAVAPAPLGATGGASAGTGDHAAQPIGQAAAGGKAGLTPASSPRPSERAATVPPTTASARAEAPPASPGNPTAPAEPTTGGPTPEPPSPVQERAQLERLRRSVQKKYDHLVEHHGIDQVGGIVGELVRAMNSQFDRLIDAPDHYDELHSRLDDLDRLLEERRKAFGP